MPSTETETGAETPEEIAADIAARRAALGRRIAALEARATPERLLVDAGARLAQEGGALGRRAGREMAANPLATAAVLGGLAWLAVSAARGTGGDSADRPPAAGVREAEEADALLERERARARTARADGAA